MKPVLFDDWDLDQSGTINRQELLFCLEAFCKIQNVPFPRRVCFEILEKVDVSHDDRLDPQEWTNFLAEFSRAVDVSLFGFVYFMMDFLSEREEWDDAYQRLHSNQSSTRPSVLFGQLWNNMHSSFVKEL